jgi:hypothetical protein
MILCIKEILKQPIVLSVIEGIVTATILGIFGLIWRKYHQWRVKQLGELLQTIIEHRNIGAKVVTNAEIWINKAEELEREAVVRGNRVSSASGRLIQSLGQYPDFPVDKKVKNKRQKHFVSLLTEVINRIQDILKRHDK